jgi:hypothetical protein
MKSAKMTAAEIEAEIEHRRRIAIDTGIFEDIKFVVLVLGQRVQRTFACQVVESPYVFSYDPEFDLAIVIRCPGQSCEKTVYKEEQHAIFQGNGCSY